jgi:dTDP-4-dehydrorhamnose 3,5-epimerase
MRVQHERSIGRQLTFQSGKRGGERAVLESIPGVRLIRLRRIADVRGAYTEVFRDEWDVGVRPTQWNVSHSNAGTLRGVQAHRRRYDYTSVLWGRLFLALHDTRPSSPVFGKTLTGEFRPGDGLAIVIPPRVAHGLYHIEDSVTLIGFSDAWDPVDDFRCRHSAPELGIEWPGPVEHMSPSDRAGLPYRQFLEGLGEG